jgi:hypothetical protein
VLKILFPFLAALLSIPAALGQTVLLNESDIKAVLRNGSTVVVIPVTNPTDRPVEAYLRLGRMAIGDDSIPMDARKVTIPPGRSEIETPLSIAGKSLWTRLYYSMVPDRGDPRSLPQQAASSHCRRYPTTCFS